MPHIDVSLYPGKSAELKQEMAQKIVNLFSSEFKFPPETLSVSFTEIEANRFDAEIVKKFDRKDLIIASDFVK